MIPSPALARVEAGALCAGCGLCAGVSGGAVAMETRAPGYARPVQRAELAPPAERAVRDACPGLSVAPWDAPAFAGAKVHWAWGPYHDCLTGYALDDEVRFTGSSGGALSALAIHALEAGLVDRVVHVRADPAQPTRNLVAISRDRADVLAGAGSRYAASSPLAGIEDMLAEGGRALFIGKPCDVSALRQLALLDPRVDEVIPYKLSFFCGGLPSHAGADRIVQAMGLEPARLSSFRYRGEGWPGLTVAMDDAGTRGEMRYEDSWGGHLSKEVQFRCKICPDAVGGVADIACADAWYGGEGGYPAFEEADGRSLVMVRSAAGRALLDGALAGGRLTVEPLAIGEIELMQPSQARRKRRIAARIAACRATLKPAPRIDGLRVGQAARKEKGLALIRDFLGTARRIILKLR